MSKPTFAQLVQVHSRHLAGDKPDAIALRLGLDVAQIREVLNPTTHHEGGNPHD